MTDAPDATETAERSVPPIRFTSFLPFATIALVSLLGFWPTSFTVNGDEVECGAVLGSSAGLEGFDAYADAVSDEPLTGTDRDLAEVQTRIACSDARNGRSAWMLLAGVAGLALYLPTRARNVPF